MFSTTFDSSEWVFPVLRFLEIQVKAEARGVTNDTKNRSFNIQFSRSIQVSSSSSSSSFQVSRSISIQVFDIVSVLFLYFYFACILVHGEFIFIHFLCLSPPLKISKKCLICLLFKTQSPLSEHIGVGMSDVMLISLTIDELANQLNYFLNYVFQNVSSFLYFVFVMLSQIYFSGYFSGYFAIHSGRA